MAKELAWSYRVILSVYALYVAFFALIWLMTPLKALAGGFLLGGLISLYNIYHLTLRVRIAGLRILSGSRNNAGLHMITRILMVVFGALLVYRLPDWIDYRSFVLSLPFGYFLFVAVVTIYYLRKTTSPHEGGETLGSDSESEISGHDI